MNGNICDACQTGRLLTARHDCGNWKSSSEAELIADMEQDDVTLTILYVHGNRTTQLEAREKALNLLRALECRSLVPIRLILFSWPSEKPDRLFPKRIVEDKKSIIQVSGFYLAGFLSRLPTDRVESIVGFSFGCAVASAALHLQAGGAICGRTMADDSQRLTNGVRLGFIAPAFDRSALTQCGEYSLAPNLIDSLVNLYNSNDPILRRFRFFDRDNPDAAGLLGLVPSQHRPLALEGCMLQYDCSGIGSTHAEKDYYSCNKLSILLDNALGKEIQ